MREVGPVVRSMLPIWRMADAGILPGTGVDCSAALQALLNAASAAGGGTVTGSGAYTLAADVSIPSRVSLEGTPLLSFTAANGATFTRAMLICGAYVAGGGTISGGGFGNRYGTLKNIYLNGNSVAPIGLYVGESIQRTFENIDIEACTAIGIAIDGAQNNTFISLHIAGNGSNPAGTYDTNMLLDRGAGNNTFLQCELSASNTVARGRYNLLIRQSGSSWSGAFTKPSYNQFFGSVIERAQTDYVASIYLRAGAFNSFYGGSIQMSGARTCVKVDTGDGTVSLPFHFIGCSFSGTAGQTTAFDLSGAFHMMLTNCFLENFGTGFSLTDNSDIILSGLVHQSTITTNFANAGGGTKTRNELVRHVSDGMIHGRAVIQKRLAFADGDTTPSVAGGNVFNTSNTSATSITAFDDGLDGQAITVKVDANTTLVNSGSLVLAGAANFVGTNNDVISLVKISSIWCETGRSIN